MEASKNQPFFSVVIPVYNRGNIVGSAVQSVLDQTFADFEIILVDDGSTDNSVSVARAIKDERLRVLCQPNAGGSAARNRGIDEATGKYIAFLDSDDNFLPRHLESMKAVVEMGANIVAYSPIIVDRGGGNTFVKPPRAIRSNESMADYVMRDRGFVQTSGLVVPAELAKRVRYRLGLPFGQDTDFAIRLDLAGAEFKMAPAPTVVWNDVYDPNRVSSARKGDRVIGWLEDMKPVISKRAYIGYRGWHVAKGLAPKDPVRAALYYIHALVMGCYRPKLAAAILLQIILPTAVYRKIADRYVNLSSRSIDFPG